MIVSANPSQRSAFTIVFNGDFTLEQCVENAMPVFDRYVIVQGATECLAHISNDCASTDRTLEIIDRLLVKYPDKLVAVSGAWEEKLAMCNAAMRYLNPGLVWQLDCDEFYHRDAMVRMMDFMDANPQFTEVEFWGYHFFGGFTHHTPMMDMEWGNEPPWRRLFRWNGEPWLSHTPPRLDRPAKVLERYGHDERLFHYGYCWHRQVLEKVMYHNRDLHRDRLQEYAMSVLSGPKNLVKFLGEHPVDVSKFAQH